MVRRNYKVTVMFTKDEYSAMREKAARAGMTAGVFIRSAVCGAKILEAPNEEVPGLISELRRTGSTLYGLLMAADRQMIPGTPAIEAAIEETRAVERKIAGAYEF